MFAWLSANLINLALIAVIALFVALVIRGMIRDKKAGKSSCGGNCAGCGACRAGGPDSSPCSCCGCSKK